MNTQRKGAALWIGVPVLLIAVWWSVNNVSGAESEPLKESARTVLENYETIQRALAGDSMTGIAKSARAIARTIHADGGKSLPLTIAEQAEKLANAKDIKAARKAFKPLSASLIAWLADNKVESSGYQEAYCPMADANWLQKEDKINNPYYGKKMLDCGAFDRRF